MPAALLRVFATSREICHATHQVIPTSSAISSITAPFVEPRLTRATTDSRKPFAPSTHPITRTYSRTPHKVTSRQADMANSGSRNTKFTFVLPSPPSPPSASLSVLTSLRQLLSRDPPGSPVQDPCMETSESALFPADFS